MDHIGALARLLEEYGRNGDSHLVHVNDEEMKKLKAEGGSGTRNPATGLYEFFDDVSGGSSAGSMTGGSAGDIGSLGDPRGEAGLQSGFGGIESQGGSGATGVNTTSDRAIGLSGTSPNSQAMQSNNPNIGPDAMQGLLGQDISGSHLSGRNAALDMIGGKSPSFGSRVEDYLGIDNPGGVINSNAIRDLSGVVGGLVGGPFGAIGGSALTGLLQGRDPLSTLANAAIGGVGYGIGSATGIPSGIVSSGIKGIAGLFDGATSSPSTTNSSSVGGANEQNSLAYLSPETNTPQQVVSIATTPSSTIQNTASATQATPTTTKSPYAGDASDLSSYLASIGAYLKGNQLSGIYG